MKNMLLTNDDGIHSAPFRAFWEALLDRGDIDVCAVVPEKEMSAAGKGITIHKPLRVWKIPTKIRKHGYRVAYLISGTPGDTVTFALRYIMEDKPEVVASGINVGDNITVDNLFTSGTIAAAIQGALLGIPSAAFSVEISQEEEPRPADKFRNQARVAAEIVNWILERKGLPEGADLLNVNFPIRISSDTQVKITRMARMKFENYILERMDPRGKPYYWIGSNPLSVTDDMKGTDYYALAVERAISITPVNLNLSVLAEECERVLPKREEIFNELMNLVEAVKSVLEDLKSNSDIKQS